MDKIQKVFPFYVNNHLKDHKMKPTLATIAITMLLFSFYPIYSCTIFMASKGGKTLVGNNEDFIDPESYVWFLPSENGKYGRVYFGFGIGLPQGGMNDQGLFFDYAALPPSGSYTPPEKKVYAGSLVEKAMEECASIDEVIKLFDSYDRQFMVTYQLMFADKFGNAVIIESDTLIRKKGDYQICTNFRQSLGKENPYSIERYNIINEMLNKSEDISVDLFRSMLAKSHQEPGQKHGSPTQYSNIYDLKNGVIYLYHFHNYADVVKIDLYEELTKGEHSSKISSLFTPGLFAYEKYAERTSIKKRTAISIDPSVFDNYVGDYQVNGLPSISFHITQHEDQLFCRMGGLRAYCIYPEAEAKYFFNVMDSQIEFHRDDNGKVNSLSFTLYGSTMPAKRIH